MPIKNRKIVKTDDIVTILEQYRRESNVKAYKRLNYACAALLKFWSGMKVTEINVPTCRAYVQFRQIDDIATSTAARELGVLRAACNHARKWERTSHVPVFEIPGNLPRRESWLFKDELAHLVKNSEVLIQQFINLCYGTGSRRRAIEELEWSQINFKRRTINLSKQNEVQTNKRRPTVPMGHLFDMLTGMHQERQNEWVLGSDKDLLYEFEKSCKIADLLYLEDRDGRPADKLTPHLLRHSRATHLLEDGASIYAVAKLLGDNPLTIQRTYGHISMSGLEDELNMKSDPSSDHFR